jgi:hypothetical protein
VSDSSGHGGANQSHSAATVIESSSSGSSGGRGATNGDDGLVAISY